MLVGDRVLYDSSVARAEAAASIFDKRQGLHGKRAKGRMRLYTFVRRRDDGLHVEPGVSSMGWKDEWGGLFENASFVTTPE